MLAAQMTFPEGDGVKQPTIGWKLGRGGKLVRGEGRVPRTTRMVTANFRGWQKGTAGTP